MKNHQPESYDSPYVGHSREQRLELLQTKAAALQRRHAAVTGALNPNLNGPGAFNGAARVSMLGQLNEQFTRVAGLKPADLELLATSEEGWRVRDGERSTHNGLRIITEQNWMVPSLLFAAMFFDTQSLAPDDQVIYQRRTKQEIELFQYGKNGKPKRFSFTDEQFYSNGVPVTLKWLSTRRVEYPLMDLNKGSLREAALETFDLGTDMAAAVDAEAKAMAVAGAYTTWNFTGSPVARIINAHSRVVTANFPTTNIIAGGANPNLLTLCRAVKAYCGAWGTGAFHDGDLAPTGRILVPSGDVDRIIGLSDLSTVSAAKSALGEQLQKEGWTTFHFLGIDWQLVPDNTLASGVLYPQLNKPIGTIFFKPAFDKEVVKVEDEKDELGGDYESRYLKKPLGVVLPVGRRVNGLKITYSFA